jgi:hypothetical protein
MNGIKEGECKMQTGIIKKEENYKGKIKEKSKQD